MLSHFHHSWLFAILYFLYPTRFPCPWDSPGKNTEVGCHSLLQGIFPIQGSNPCLLHCRQIPYHLSHQGSYCVLSHSVMFDSATPWTVAYQDPLYMGILQARILEWITLPSSRGSSLPKDQTQVSCISGRFLSEPPEKLKSNGVGCLFLLQGIFPTQESNWGPMHCRRIL